MFFSNLFVVGCFLALRIFIGVWVFLGGKSSLFFFFLLGFYALAFSKFYERTLVGNFPVFQCQNLPLNLWYKFRNFFSLFGSYQAILHERFIYFLFYIIVCISDTLLFEFTVYWNFSCMKYISMEKFSTFGFQFSSYKLFILFADTRVIYGRMISYYWWFYFYFFTNGIALIFLNFIV